MAPSLNLGSPGNGHQH